MTGNSSERERHFANTKESRPANASASIFIITISVNIDLYERLAQHARTSGVNQNQIIIEMLDNNLPQP